MTTALILYWEQGSCGDFVQSLLLADRDRYTGIVDTFDADSQGRIVPTPSKFFKENFKHTQYQYTRTWTVDECNAIKNISDHKLFVIPTHRQDQVEFLKSQWPDCLTVGITYPKNCFMLVLKNWCKKVGWAVPAINNAYNQPVHQLFKSKGVFGEFILKEQLKHGADIRSHVDCEFDICVNLEDLYAGNLSSVLSLTADTNQAMTLYQQWISKQNVLHRYRFNTAPELKTALGYNTKVDTDFESDVDLDQYDNILIQHYCQTHNINAPTFTTLSQANNFFKTQVRS